MFGVTRPYAMLTVKMKEYAMCSTLIRWLSNKARPIIRLCIACSFILQAHAQVLQPQRYEIPLTDHEKHFEIIPAADKGLYLQRSLFSDRKDNQIQLTRLDTAFQLQWNGFIPMEQNYLLMGRKAFKDKLYL